MYRYIDGSGDSELDGVELAERKSYKVVEYRWMLFDRFIINSLRSDGIPIQKNEKTVAIAVIYSLHYSWVLCRLGDFYQARVHLLKVLSKHTFFKNKGGTSFIKRSNKWDSLLAPLDCLSWWIKSRPSWCINTTSRDIDAHIQTYVTTNVFFRIWQLSFFLFW